MKRDQKITKLAKKLLELSMDNGVVTESKVAEVLAGFQQVKHRHHLAVLKTFLNYLRREVALKTAVVSTPTGLSDDALRAIEAQFSELLFDIGFVYYFSLFQNAKFDLKIGL